MCFNPIKIYNRKRLFRTGFDSAVLTVPCGKCLECREQKQNDFVFRTWYELQKVNRSHPYVQSFFLTLTFDRYSVPVVHTERFYPIDQRYKGKGINYSTDVAAINANRLAKGLKIQFVSTDTESVRMVPDYSMVEKFFKKLRSRLERDCPHFKFDISYLCATELGDKYFDERFQSLHLRPHYHLILIVGCNQYFSEASFFQYIKDAWTISKRITVNGRFKSVDTPIGRITNDRLFTDKKFEGQMRNDFQAVKYVCKYVTKDIGVSGGEKEQSCRLRLSIGFGMPEVDEEKRPLPDFITEQEYLQGFKFLPFGKDGENKKFLIPVQYYQRKKLTLKEYAQENKKNASYVKRAAKEYLFSPENPRSRYNRNCLATSLNVKDFLNNVKVDSSFLARCKSQRLINKADSIFNDIGSAFLYEWQPHLLKAFEDMYGISFSALKEFSNHVSHDDFLDYIHNIRPWIYWKYKSYRYDKFMGFDMSQWQNNKCFPYRFFTQRLAVWSDTFDCDIYLGIELLLTFYEYYKECIKSIREDMLLTSEKSLNGYVKYIKTLKHYDEFQSSLDNAGGRYSRNVVESVQLWCDPFTHRFHRFKSCRTSA